MQSKVTDLVQKLNDLSFKDIIQQQGGEIFVVGGMVRDALLNKESKDFDIMITKIEKDNLITILTQFGRVDLVGESFGIIKFKEFNSDEYIDISIPRNDKSSGNRGHKSFDVTTDPFLPIEDDLLRRDITINSMAIDIHGNIIDPFGGLEDIKNEFIRATNLKTFYEDPLRMLRCIGFSSRFNFSIERETYFSISQNAKRIEEISSERILIELDKIVKKGNIELGTRFLNETGLHSAIFGISLNIKQGNYNRFNLVKTLGEYIFLLGNSKVGIADFYKDTLKGDVDTFKEIKALEKLNTINLHSSSHMWKVACFEALTTYPNIINTKIFNTSSFFDSIDGFIKGNYPKSIKELDIKGEELMEAGLIGVEIGKMQKTLINLILDDQFINENEQIKKYLISSKCIIPI